MFNLAKKFLKIYDFYKKSNKINGVYILDYVHKSLILKAFINFDKKLRHLCCKKRAFCPNTLFFAVKHRGYKTRTATQSYNYQISGQDIPVSVYDLKFKTDGFIK